MYLLGLWMYGRMSINRFPTVHLWFTDRNPKTSKGNDVDTKLGVSLLFHDKEDPGLYLMSTFVLLSFQDNLHIDPSFYLISLNCYCISRNCDYYNERMCIQRAAIWKQGSGPESGGTPVISVTTNCAIEKPRLCREVARCKQSQFYRFQCVRRRIVTDILCGILHNVFTLWSTTRAAIVHARLA
jgi:hypothetical protein